MALHLVTPTQLRGKKQKRFVWLTTEAHVHLSIYIMCQCSHSIRTYLRCGPAHRKRDVKISYIRVYHNIYKCIVLSRKKATSAGSPYPNDSSWTYRWPLSSSDRVVVTSRRLEGLALSFQIPHRLPRQGDYGSVDLGAQLCVYFYSLILLLVIWKESVKLNIQKERLPLFLLPSHYLPDSCSYQSARYLQETEQYVLRDLISTASCRYFSDIKYNRAS
jgi:hypothetical protein